MFGMCRPHLRLAGIKPEIPDTALEIVSPGLVPVKVARIRVERVVIGQEMHPARILVRKLDHRGDTALGAQQISPFAHFRVVFRICADRRPDRDDGLYTHLVKLAHHAFRVGPFLGVEFPLALSAPGKEVSDDAGERQSALAVSAGDVQDLLLGTVAQSGLPEAGNPIRTGRRVA